MKKKQENFNMRVLIAALAATIVIIIFSQTLGRKTTQTVVPQNGAQKSSQIQSPNDLNTVSTDLDNTNLDELDTQLNQINTDASSF